MPSRLSSRGVRIVQSAPVSTMSSALLRPSLTVAATNTMFPISWIGTSTTLKGSVSRGVDAHPMTTTSRPSHGQRMLSGCMMPTSPSRAL